MSNDITVRTCGNGHHSVYPVANLSGVSTPIGGLGAPGTMLGVSFLMLVIQLGLENNEQVKGILLGVL